MILRSIKVLHLTNTLGYGGVEKIVYQLCMGTKDKFQEVVVVSGGGAFAERLQENGVQHYIIPDLSTKNPVEIYKIIKEIKHIVKKHNINMIHCHHRMAVLFAKIACHGIKIIYNNHTIYSDKRILSHFVLQNVNIIADGQQAKVNVVDYFKIADEKITIINNAVDADDGFFSEVPEIRREKDKGNFIVLNSSRLHPQKGIFYYLEAAKILKEKGFSISFFIVGDGEQRLKVEEYIKVNNLKDCVFMLGFRKDIKNVIKQVDVLVLTSVYEGLPLTPMEAFSVKRSVIATNIDGTREVVEDGYNGLLAEPCNPDSVAQKIQMLFENRVLLQKCSDGAIETYRSKFCLGVFINEYIKYYESL
ncbi:MAG: glycosyltransferase family 4 protein [Candidatus Gastranaerophilales bacterium]|nr:glycosyltransferase family 4 protein [Candidatus Gastranaerophilales bacterium]